MKGHMKTEFKYYGVPKAIMDKLEGNPFVASDFIKVAKECNMTWTEKQYHVMKKNIDHTSNNIKKIKVDSSIIRYLIVKYKKLDTKNEFFNKDNK